MISWPSLHVSLSQKKTNIITELEAKNLSLAKNDSKLRQKMEDADRFVLSSKVTMEELKLFLNKQTEMVEQLVDQIRSKNEEVTELKNENHRLERNDQRLRQITEETKLLLVSSNDELENLRVCLAEQQLVITRGRTSSSGLYLKAINVCRVTSSHCQNQNIDT